MFIHYHDESRRLFSLGASQRRHTMPMISIQYATPRTTSVPASAIAKTVRQLSSEILHKDPNVTAIAVEQLEAANWFVADKSLAEHGLAGFWLDIRITDGTNTRDEKAAFVAAAFAAMNKLVGPLHSESYVHVDDVCGDAYGYGGLTQNERHFAEKLKTRAKVAA
jgi:4-oxalocrotonate tautomerase